MRHLVLALMALGCGSSPSTPESIVDGAADGDQVEFDAFVHTLTFDSTPTTDGPDGTAWTELPDRFLLVRSAQPPGVTMDDLDKTAIDAAWGLGVRIPADQLDGALPHIGDQVHVAGRFTRITWSGFDNIPVIEDATIDVVDGIGQGGAPRGTTSTAPAPPTTTARWARCATSATRSPTPAPTASST